MSAHTKGPWRAGSGTGGKGAVVSDILADGALGGSDEFDFYGGNMIAESVAQENIPVISAAPELLAALIGLRAAFADYVGPNSAAADAAIAKATGSAK